MNHIGITSAIAAILISLSVIPVWGSAASPEAEPAGTAFPGSGAGRRVSAYPGVSHLIQRTLPGRSDVFRVDSMEPYSGREVFEIDAEADTIVLRGSTPSAAAFAFNYYLKYFCHCSLSRMGVQLSIAGRLPVPSIRIRKTTPYTHRYFLNYCTFNYSMSWYDWAAWEKELDWMALNGINLALAVTGTEKVWQGTLRRFGFSDDELSKFIPGPAQSAWWLMGNLEGWRGPVSQDWIDGQSDLQQKILTRMNELGIEPVMQGFYGMVPRALAGKYASHRILDQGLFGGFNRPAYLDPADSLFAPMAEAFYEELTGLYGKARFYGGDPFHEGGRAEGIDVKKAASIIQHAMMKSSPGATWVLQGWQGNPRDELLAGIDHRQALVLDLNAESSPNWEKRNAYDETPWLWCAIINFGNATVMHGKLDSMFLSPSRALRSPQGKYLRGIGLLMEGFDNDPVNYDLMFESAWGIESASVAEWMKGFTRYRYGKSVPAAEEAWEILRRTVYAEPGQTDPIVCARPSDHVDRVVTWGSSKIWFDTGLLGAAARKLLECSGELKGIDTYEYDLVSVTRQYVSSKAHGIYERSMEGYREGDSAAFRANSRFFLGILSDLDSLLGTRKEYLLGRWIADARRAGARSGEADLFELNARTLITVWGDSASAVDLHDYSYRQWAGMLSGFYLPRWKMFFSSLGKRMAGEHAAAIDFYGWEEAWCHGNEKYASEPTRDAVRIAGRLLRKYRD